MPNAAIPPLRTIVYVDGFNLYFGIKSNGWRKYYWLDIWEMGNKLAKGRQLESVKYFTADIGGPGGKVQRQQTFLNALQVHTPQLEIIKGKYLRKTLDCHHCLRTIHLNEEKMTDVNIATHLLNDAWKDRFDLAIVVSGDSDLVPPISTVKAEFPQKRVVVAFPPKRSSFHLKQTTTTFYINERVFKKSQMPDVVIKPDGSQLRRPGSWQ